MKKTLRPEMCDCCLEIWATPNLTIIDLGEHDLRLCPDCIEAFNKKYKKIEEKE